MRHFLEDAAVWARMSALRWTHWRPFCQAASDPKGTQQRLLLDLVRRNCQTAFGREHHFAKIHDYSNFVDAVPVQTYESLRPYIERQQKGEAALTAGAPVLYAQTSGTTGKPKLIPLLDETLSDYRRIQATQSYVLFQAEPDVFYGRILGIASPAVEGHLESGTPYGSASGHVYRTMPRRARARYVLPEEVLGIQDYELKYLVIVALALGCSDIGCIATANPSTLLKLIEVFREHREMLLRDLADRTLSYADRLTAEQRQAVLPRMKCSAGRIRELKALLKVENPSVADLWPRLRVISTWTGGSCGVALGAVKEVLPPAVRVVELGYLSSEFRGTVTVDVESNAGAPTISQNYLEFAERESWDQGEKKFLTVEALEQGKQYYIVVTTAGGLYRYFMNDVVEVSGRFHNTPCIRFVQKGSGVTNITGEKLSESQVIQAVRSAEQAFGWTSPFFVMLADTQGAVYRLVVEWADPKEQEVEGLRGGIEQELRRQNIEYKQKQDSGRLAPLTVVPLKEGTGHVYKRHCVERGQREAQFKVLALQYSDRCSFPFGDFAAEIRN